MRRQKLFVIILSLILAFAQISYAQSMNIIIDDSSVTFTKDSGEPYIDSNARTLVPFRVVLERFGCEVEWNQDERIATASKNGMEVQVPIGKPFIYINGVQTANDTSAQIRDGRTYLPIRAVLEALGASVAWDPYTNAVIVDSSGAPILIKNPALADKQAAIVDHVIDGDTFVLDSGDKVRMIGIDTPEVAGPYTQAEFYGEEASAYAKSVLTGETVYLDKDTSNTDKYDRLLRYVYLEDGTFFNLLLILEGYAEAVEYPPDTKYADQFEAAEDAAQENRKGMWCN